MKEVPNLVPTRIDRDPVAFMGITGPELNSIALLSIPGFILGLILSLIVFGNFLGAIFTGFIFVAITLFGGVLVLARIKNNKPPHYILHKRLKIMGDMGFKKAPFIYKTEKFRSTRD